MKRIIILLIILQTVTFCFSDPIRDEVYNDTQYNFTLIPYDGGMGIYLGSKYYPQHDSTGNDLHWARWYGVDGEKAEYKDAYNIAHYVDLLPTEGSGKDAYCPYYSDYHIISIGGAYNIPFSKNERDYIDNRMPDGFKKILNLPSDANSICIPRDGISLTINASCDSGFEFVSQSNPIYRRPFKIEVIPRVATQGTGDSVTETEYISTLDDLSNTTIIDVPNTSLINDGHTIRMLAADMIIVLPYDYSRYDSDGGYFSGGLTYDNATYTLADLDDYTAVVTITLTLNFEYSYYSGNVEHTETYTDTRILTIPFSGFYTSSGSKDVRNDSISLFVNATNEAANLNLANQGQWITVGNMQFLYVDSTRSFPADANNDVVRIFLSSRPYPDVHGTSTFRMIHENATNVITNTNSLGFDARIIGTGSNSGDILLSANNSNTVSNTVDFDGLAYLGNIAGGNTPSTKEKDVVKTVCNYGAISNNLAPRHFHTFEGDIAIRFNESDMLDAGIYRGYIYVHAVTEGKII